MAAGPQGGPQGGPPLPQAPLPPQQAAAHASAVSGPDEDKEVMHNAFLAAYGTSHHGPRIHGMQEFAGAVRPRAVRRAARPAARSAHARQPRAARRASPAAAALVPARSCWRASASPLASTPTRWATSLTSSTATSEALELKLSLLQQALVALLRR